MYTENINTINKIYINLYNKECIFEDYEKWLDLIDYFKFYNIDYIFRYNSLKYKYINEILDYMSCCANQSVFYIDDYKDFELIDNFKFLNYKVNLKFESDFSILYRKKLLDVNSNLLFNSIKNNYNVIVDIFVKKNNIFCLYETLKLFSDKNIKCNVVFYEASNSSYYDNYNTVNKNNLINNDIGTQLILDRILLDNKILLNNKDEMIYVFNNGFKSKCNLNLKFDSLYLTSNFCVQLCDKIENVISKNIFELLDNNSFNDKAKELICKNYSQYCNGCSCYNKMGRKK